MTSSTKRPLVKTELVGRLCHTCRNKNLLGAAGVCWKTEKTNLFLKKLGKRIWTQFFDGV